MITKLDPCPFCGGKAEWDEKNKATQCSHYAFCIFL